MSTFYKRYVCLLFLFINVTLQSYCFEIKGLKIKLPLRTQEESSNSSSSLENLTNIEDDCSFTTRAEEDVACAISLGIDESVYDVDTDEEASVSEVTRDGSQLIYEKIDQLSGAAKDTIPHHDNRSRHPDRAQFNQRYKCKNNYLKAVISSDRLHNQLSIDAFDIVGSEPNDRTKKSTVCLCVALRDKHKHVKKFAFHNGEHIMSLAMRNKACVLGYDVIQAQQSHAEGQLIQFLIGRDQKRPGWYTHILGVGCSRSYCAECKVLFRGCLGDNCHRFIASVDAKQKGNNGPRLGQVSAISESINSKEAERTDDSVAYTQRITQEVNYEVVKGEKAFDDAIYDNFYLPEALQQIIKYMTGKNWDLSGGRFRKEDAEKQRRKRK
jgi:hypothetical protein